MARKEYPITAENMGMTDYTRAEFHGRINMSNFPFKPMGQSYDMRAGMEDYPLPRNGNSENLKKYICQVGTCSGVDVNPKQKPKKYYKK